MRRFRRLGNIISHQEAARRPLQLYRGWYPVRAIHDSTRRFAVPLPHLAAPGPPPSPPKEETTNRRNSLHSHRQKSESFAAPKASDGNSKKASGLLKKRFWREVHIKETEGCFQVLLDKRPVRVAGRNALAIPKSKPHLAAGVALEWDLLKSASQALKQHYIPITSLISRALDIQTADDNNNSELRDEIVNAAMKYLSTDSLLCWAPDVTTVEANVEDEDVKQVQGLRNVQMKIAHPIITYLTETVWPRIELRPILRPDSILPLSQSDETNERVRQWVAQLPSFELAGLERAFLASKSLLIAARLIVQWSEAFTSIRNGDVGEERFDIDRAAAASMSEVAWQTERWGEVEDTHDVDKEDLRRQLGSAILLVSAIEG